MTTVSDYTALLSGSSWLGIAVAGTPVVVTYSFEAIAPPYVQAATGGFDPLAASSFQAFNAAEKTAGRDALNKWAAVSGIHFVEVAAGQGEIAFSKLDFAHTPNDGSGGFALTPTRSFFLSGYGVDSADFDGDNRATRPWRSPIRFCTKSATPSA